MSDIAIRCEGISKQYRIGERERYKALRDVITDAVRRPFRRLRQAATTTDRNGSGRPTIWALQDVSFEVKQGEVVGIIGRNGAGKSTFLKILSRITEPTCGYAEVNGRVGSLLEVGTGFHPELTGRDNIFLSGAILGMKKAEIARKFDEIVGFAEVEKFIDTPVKHYSSGMYVRLAFAVAAHLEPEILLVDEVLAVGDLEFQKKCLGKMGQVAKGGRTIILVSHSMASIASLCSTGVYLSGGRLGYHGPVDEAINRYLAAATGHSNQADLAAGSEERGGTGEVRFQSARVLNDSSQPCSQFLHGQDLVIEFRLRGQTNYTKYLGVVLIRTLTGVPALHIPTPPEFRWPSMEESKTLSVRCRIPKCRLYPGTYVVSLWLGRNAHLEVDSATDALTFTIEHGSLVRYGFDMSWRHGLYFCDSDWVTVESAHGCDDLRNEPPDSQSTDLKVVDY
jgi:lipopolysaccharide transport system ATP-binding protein